jgi:hypothetical protein
MNFLLVRCTSRQSLPAGHATLGASLERSPAATPLRCSGFGRAEELAARAMRAPLRQLRRARARSALRALTLTPVLLSVPEAPPGRHARQAGFAEARLARNRLRTTARFRGRRCPAGAISVAARSAATGSARKARFVSGSPRLFERSAQRAASSAARPCGEHHSAVEAKRRPPLCEPPAGTACREASDRENK